MTMLNLSFDFTAGLHPWATTKAEMQFRNR
jgi:hypothetical protein